MAGDYSGALMSAQTARYLAWGAILCGVILYVIVIVVTSAWNTDIELSLLEISGLGQYWTLTVWLEYIIQ
jgi:hypothetical protein